MTTTQEQELIENAAKEYANTGSFQEWLKLQPFGAESSFSKTKRNFRAGISFALSSLLPGRLKHFLEWTREAPGDTWLHEGDVYTTDQLVGKYFEQLKQKE